MSQAWGSPSQGVGPFLAGARGGHAKASPDLSLGISGTRRRGGAGLPQPLRLQGTAAACTGLSRLASLELARGRARQLTPSCSAACRAAWSGLGACAGAAGG